MKNTTLLGERYELNERIDALRHSNKLLEASGGVHLASIEGAFASNLCHLHTLSPSQLLYFQHASVYKTASST
jgi:hypothetical protein